MTRFYSSMEISKSLYDQVGGFDKVLELTRRWHVLCLQDPDAAHPFEHPMHPQHDERLAAYLAEVIGGSKLYTAGYGDESHVQRLHAGNGEHVELDEACLRLFDQALLDVGITDAPGQSLSDYFRRATEEMRVFSGRDATVPEGLPLNHAW